MGTDWYYTLVFIFSILGILKMVTEIIMNFTSFNPTQIKFERNELIFYGLCFSYFLTYLIT